MLIATNMVSEPCLSFVLGVQLLKDCGEQALPSNCVCVDRIRVAITTSAGCSQGWDSMPEYMALELAPRKTNKGFDFEFDFGDGFTQCVFS